MKVPRTREGEAAVVVTPARCSQDAATLRLVVEVAERMGCVMVCGGVCGYGYC